MIMKIASGILTLTLAGNIAVDGMSIRGNSKHANKLMAFSRRLENSGDSGNAEEYGDSGDMNDEEKEIYFLKDYSINLISCIQGEQVINYENGESESSTVIFRLCPSDSCDSSTSLQGCDEGYGDYVVGIDTFLEAYMESQGESNDEENGNSMIVYNQWGEEFDASEYMECAEYRLEEGEEQQQGQNNGANYYNDMKFYIGPGCSKNGTSIALQTYMDEECTYSFQGNFSTISPGWDSLPFSDGGLVSLDCEPCYGADEDGNMAVSEICQQQFQSSFARCDQGMESDNYYNYHYTTSSGCDYVDSLLNSVYGNLTKTNQDTLSAVKTTVGNVGNAVGNAVKKGSTRFMDTLSSRETRLFIAGMVIFALSFFIGVSAIACLCVKKRRQRKSLKKREDSKLLPTGTDDDATEGLAVQKRRSSVLALVRANTANIVAAVKKSKANDEDGTVHSEYNNMDDAIVNAKQESISATVSTTDPSPMPNDATPERSTSASDATEKTKGGRFLSKMDKHLKKKLSVKKK